jgi:enamine deaminase RidA (YjgF/YER057c/UK114 family)
MTEGDFIYVGGTRADQGGDVATQTRRVLERIRAVLAEHGSSLGDVLATTVYLRCGSDFQSMNDAYRAFWSKEPPTRTTVVADLEEPRALVEISAVAVRTGGDRTVVHPEHWIASPNPYSYAIRSGDTVFLSGLVSRNGRDNSVVDGDVAAQTRVVLDNAGELLAAAGLGFEHVVSARVFLPDPARFGMMNAAYARYFGSGPPARTTVAAQLAGSQYVVEISIVASSAPRTTFADGLPPGWTLPLSGAVRAGRRVYASGALGLTGDNTTDVGSQAREALSRLRRSLSAAGCTLADVADVTVFLTDLRARSLFDDAYAVFFQEALPVRTTVGTALVAPDALVEIAMTAVVP